MQTKQKKHFARYAMLLVLVVLMMVPVLVSTANAKSSAKKEFSFTFNGFSGTQSVEGIKSDLTDDPDDLSSRGSAGVNITNALFGTGSVGFWMTDKAGTRLCTTVSPVNTLGTKRLYYKESKLDEMENNCTIVLKCEAIPGVQGLGGYFQP